jgi:glycosyltransferase involved in cell wall biosynthesis
MMSLIILQLDIQERWKVYFGQNMIKVSIIIPVYNQMNALFTTLHFFKNQSYPSALYEIIIVDDGSTDGLPEEYGKNAFAFLPCDVCYVKQTNRGRAAARNAGVDRSRGSILIFNDADRFPDPHFINKHVAALENKRHLTSIGCAWEYFGGFKNLHTLDWQKIRKFSRKSLYYRRIMKIYKNGITRSPLAWASFLVGNSGMYLDDFLSCGGFDQDFTSWGFEHFELAFRLSRQGISFLHNPAAENFHIPHTRPDDFYKIHIHNSIIQFKKKHPGCSIELLEQFLNGKISLQKFEKSFAGYVSDHLREEEEIFYKQTIS